MFADDLKLFCSVRSILHAMSLDMLLSWCQPNCLVLNIDKFKLMSFYRCNASIIYDYEISNIPF